MVLYAYAYQARMDRMFGILSYGFTDDVIPVMRQERESGAWNFAEIPPEEESKVEELIQQRDSLIKEVNNLANELFHKFHKKGETPNV